VLVIKVIEQACLREMNTLALPCVAKRLIQVDTVEELKHVYSNYNLDEDNALIIGGGSNLVLPETLNMSVIQFTGNSTQLIPQDNGSVNVEVGAGVIWDDLVEMVVCRGLRGLENLSLIPGTVGAAPVQNIGAYGVEISDLLISVEVFNVKTHQVETVLNSACEFTYRDSLFKQNPGQFLILNVCLNLSKIRFFTLAYGELKPLQDIANLKLADIRARVIEVRTAKLPDPKALPNVGSFFKNPIISLEQAEQLNDQYPALVSYPLPSNSKEVKLAAGWLIDQAGWKGHRERCVGVHDQQALVLINHTNGSQQELLSLVEKIQRSVWEIFQVQLELEPIIIY